MPYVITPQLKRVYHLNYISRPGTREKLRCRERCSWAIKSGKLTRLPCLKCGAERAEAHHDDYSKPFDVRWLCRKCHGAEHRKSHCKSGHALTDDNIVLSNGKRQCRQCHRDFETRARRARSALRKV